MTKKNQKLLWLSIPFAFILLVIFFHQAIISHFLLSSLEDFSREALKGELHAEKIYRKESALVLEHPVLLNSKELGFAADQITIDYSFKPWALALDMRITLREPQVEVAQSIAQLSSLAAHFSGSSWLKINPEVAIQKGSIHVRDERGLQHSAFIDWEKERFQINLGDPNQHMNVLTLKLEGSRSAYAEAHALDLPSLHRMMQVLWPEYKEFAVDKGLLDLKGHLLLDTSWPFLFSGEAKVSDFVFFYKPLQLRGEIPEAQIVMRDDPEKEGKFEILQGAHFAIYKEQLPFWEVRHLMGGVFFNSRQETKVAFEGSCLHHEKACELHIEGEGHPYEKGQPQLDIAVRLSGSHHHPDFSARFLVHKVAEGCNCADIRIEKIGHQEFELLQRLLSPPESNWSRVKVLSGVMDASLLALMQGIKISELKLNKIEAYDLLVDFNGGNSSLDLGRLKGEVSVNLLSSTFWDHLNANLQLSRGHFKTRRSGADFWHFSDMEMELKIEEGMVRNSQIHGNFAGLQGFITMDWLSPQEFVKLHFKGGTSELSHLLPPKLKQGMLKQFEKDQVEIVADLSRIPSGSTLNGELRIYDHSEEIRNGITFGFDLKKTSEDFWGAWPANELASAYLEAMGQEIFQKVFPTLGAPIAHFKNKALKQELGLFGFMISNGWFEAQDLPLEKYISPFIFTEGQFSLKGLGDFTGKFNHSDLSVQYTAKNLSLDNEDLAIDVEAVPDLSAKHYFNFDTGDHFGFIPVQNGTYFDKNHGLLFADINTEVFFEGKKVHIPDIDAFCNGVYLAGSIDVDYSNPFKGIFDVDVFCHTLTGKVSQVQDIFSHFDKPFFFLKMPVEGNIALHHKVGYLGFTFYPGDYRLQAVFQGGLTDGQISLQQSNIAVQELSLNIDYDHQANRLEFSDIQGAVLVGSPSHVEEYTLVGDRIRFDDYRRNQAEFDVWIGDKKRDIIRVAGKTVPATVGEDGEYVEFHIDQELTHFGDVHPSLFKLVMKNWEEVHQFDLNLEFKLMTLFHDLQRFSRTGLLFLSRSLLKEVNEIQDAQGNFSFGIHFDDQSNTTNYHLNGEGVSIGSHAFDKMLLDGKKHKSLWSLDLLQLDNLSLAAEVERQEKSWVVNFLGVRYGDALLMGLEGEYKDGEAALETKVNLFELDFAKLGHLPKMQKYTLGANVEGALRGTGTMRFELGKGFPGWHADLLLNGALRQFQLKDLALQDMENISCHLNTARGFTLRHMATSPQFNEKPLGKFVLDKLDYDFDTQCLQMENLGFDIKAENLVSFAEGLQSHMPEVVTPAMAKVIGQIKNKESFKGSLNLSLQLPEYTLHLELPEGDYFFQDRENELNHFSLDYSPHEFNLLTQYRIKQLPFWLRVYSNASDLSEGSLILSDNSHSNLNIDWFIHPEFGFKVRKAMGQFSGLNVNLAQNQEMPLSNERHHLVGEVVVDAPEAARLLPDEVAQQIQKWKIGRGFSLRGFWELDDHIQFHGDLIGRNCEFSGYQFQNLTAKVDYAPTRVNLGHVIVSDPAGAFHAEKVDFIQDDQSNWRFSSPLVLMNEFTPGLLQEAGNEPPQKWKPLEIKEVELQNLQGTLGSLESMTGEGHFSFVNPRKKNILSPLFTIPAEILSRLGLDLSVLNPVTGTVLYQLQGGKIVFTKLKDVYSEGKLSKFYLPDNDYESYIDFQGNLHLQIRLKQYNVLFKFAELFTITLLGTIEKPYYTLKKQPHKGNEVIVEEPDLLHH